VKRDGVVRWGGLGGGAAYLIGRGSVRGWADSEAVQLSARWR
jgi:hypothetical protein